MKSTLQTTGKPRRLLLLSFIAVSAALLLVVGLAFEAQREQVRRMVQDQLRAVGELKVGQIQDWVAEWMRDGSQAGSDPMIAQSFATWIRSDRQNGAAAERWRRQIETLRQIYGYDEIDLYDDQGDYCAGSGPSGHPEAGHGAPHRQEALEAIRLGRPVLVDLHRRDDHPDRVSLGVMAPLLMIAEGDETPTGAIFLGREAERSLFPLLRTWPLPTLRGETVLSRREGEQIRFLFTGNEPPLSILLPISSPNLPSARVLQGEQGILGRAVDYAGTEVLAFSDRIPGTPWMLIAKQVLEEAEAPVRRLAWNYGSVAALLFGALILIYGTMWKAEQRRHQLLLLDQELKSRLMEQEAQEAMVRLNGELEQRVQRRTAELEAALKDLEGFSYSVSHDLRAPLRAIDGFVAVLKEEYAPRLDEEGLRLLGIVSDNATKMGRLIDDILAFSRAGRLALERQEVDMKALAEEVWGALAAERGARRFEFRLADLPPAQGDPHALRQVWQNLLANAIKFTRGRDPAVIEITGERGATETCYTVKDNGVGFNADYVGKLFVLFQRLHGMDEFEGTGVGLAIVHRFVQKHDGRVEADGRPDGGATFRFTLPNSGSNGERLGT